MGAIIILAITYLLSLFAKWLLFGAVIIIAGVWSGRARLGGRDRAAKQLEKWNS
ncbi:MAG: hypothetical protein AAGB25_01905 [Pseudomonadota bacterium]